MSKKLTARVQKLNPILKEQESGFSFGVVMEPESRESSISKGNVYILFDITTTTKVDTGLVQKLVSDVLNSTYYNSDATSPIQSLEKSIYKIKDNLYQLVQENSLINASIDFNCIGAVLWGNVLYVVQYEKGHAFLMHNTDINEVETTGEGSFNSSSGLVKEDDVVILCTDTFMKKFPPKKLLMSAMSGRDLSSHDSCLLLKLIEDSTYPDVDIEDITSLESHSKGKFDNLVDAVISRVSSLGSVKPMKRDLVAAKPKINLKKSLKLSKTHLVFSLISVFTLLISVGSFMFFKNKGNDLFSFTVFKSKTITTPENALVSNTESSKEPEKVEILADDTSLDTVNKINRVKIDQTLYDLIITDLNVRPSDIEIYDNKLIVADSSSGKIYTSILGDYKFLPIEEIFAGVHNMISNKEGLLTFSDSAGIKIYNVKDLSLKSSFNSPSSGGLGIFDDFIYTFDKDTLIKYTPNTDSKSLVSSVWAQSSDFTDAHNLQVAYSIYLVTKDNIVQKYTSGKKDTWEVKGLDVPFGKITDLYAREDFKYLYIADSSNSRVVVLDLNGNFVRQFKYTSSKDWSDIKAISVSFDEKTLYVLNGTKIYEISL